MTGTGIGTAGIETETVMTTVIATGTETVIVTATATIIEPPLETTEWEEETQTQIVPSGTREDPPTQAPNKI